MDEITPNNASSVLEDLISQDKVKLYAKEVPPKLWPNYIVYALKWGGKKYEKQPIKETQQD